LGAQKRNSIVKDDNFDAAVKEVVTEQESKEDDFENP
jgi:hypothetical protein